MARTTRAILCFATLLGAAPLAAHADALFQVKVNSAASALHGAIGSQNDFPPESDTGFVPVGALPDSLSNSQTSAAAVGGASGDGHGSGQVELSAPGSFTGAVMRAIATFQAIGPASDLYATTGYGFGRSGVQYLDMLHASGGPIGTPVRLRVRLELDGAMARVGLGSTNHVQLAWTGGSAIPSAPIELLSCSDRNGACSRSDDGVVEALVGVPLGVGLQLFTQVSGQASNLGPTFASGSSDFSSTARLCIDVITPGTSYTLDSGGDLRCSASPVPQVPALPPLALGALALALGVAAHVALRR
jgi:hypothetical protein